jgi:uroporphyrin-III C-methyltransferase
MIPPVALVGAGPGDPDLLTVRALRLLRAADVILHDSLIGQAILGLARPAAICIDVGKRCGKPSAAQGEIHRLMVEHARAGARVVRLKGGDPMIFGRAAEEMRALREHGISCEIVPGITAASAAAASLGLSLTRRKVARTVHFLTGHGAEDGLPGHDWGALARAGGTLAIYMGRETVGGLAAHLIEAGLSPATPAAVIQNASRPDETIRWSSLAFLPQDLAAMPSDAPTLILLGEAMRDGDATDAESRRHAASKLAPDSAQNLVTADRSTGLGSEPGTDRNR